MVARTLAVDDQVIRIVELAFVPVARGVPHQYAITFLDGLAAQFNILRGNAAHIGQRGLPADDFRNHVGNQLRLDLQLGEFLGKLIQCEHTAAH